jgi:hypothetical protein
VLVSAILPLRAKLHSVLPPVLQAITCQMKGMTILKERVDTFAFPFHVCVKVAA